MTRFRGWIAHPGWVHSVLGVWLLAWALVLLEPCCEAVAAPLPHSRAALVPASAGHHHGGAFAVDIDGASSHDHCRHVDARDLDQPIDVTATGLKAPHHAVIVRYAIASTFPPVAMRTPAAPRLAVARASLVPLYLRTLRLRD